MIDLHDIYMSTICMHHFSHAIMNIVHMYILHVHYNVYYSNTLPLIYSNESMTEYKPFSMALTPENVSVYYHRQACVIILYYYYILISFNSL